MADEAARNPNDSGGIVAFLDLPPKSVLRLDGQSFVLKRDDFVGFKSTPRDSLFHLVTVRAGSVAKSSECPSQEETSAITVGFVLCPEELPALVRAFDPRTEEVSSNPVDELTASNLVNEIRANRMEPQRVVAYGSLLTSAAIEAWRESVCFVSSELLRKRGLSPGAKIVPGSYGFEEEDKNAESKDKISDGIAVEYPSVPVMDPSQSARTQSRHLGAKRFMANLSPSERTSFFMLSNSSERVLDHVLSLYYDNQWQELLGDVQLSYVIFLNLHCFSSLEHWRDLVAMLSLVALEGVSAHMELYINLIELLSFQVMTMEADFFDDVDMSGDNFLVPSLRRLVSTLSRIVDTQLKPSLARFVNLLKDRFLSSFEDLSAIASVESDEEMHVDSEDEEGPVVVPSEEVDASIARLSTERRATGIQETYPESLRQEYPILFSAVMPHEDVVMTCARALDEKNDVSLVREAAAYLENVEAKKAKERGFM